MSGLYTMEVHSACLFSYFLFPALLVTKFSLNGFHIKLQSVGLHWMQPTIYIKTFKNEFNFKTLFGTLVLAALNTFIICHITCNCLLSHSHFHFLTNSEEIEQKSAPL